MSASEKCPVCEGRQTVPGGFYTPGSGEETCRTCGGRGIVGVVAESASSRRPDTDDPRDLTYRR